MPTLHLISHTHWDREWYLTFQQFHLKLIHLLDGLLDILATVPEYRHFMLDGQTIVLGDYLTLRPERETALRAHIQSGRILIGPWYVLPDEFLVSPEATIRNLLEGERVARRFGAKMNVGYIPDPFGHIGQMPQILRGFGIESACVQRGLDDQPCEFWWQSPDGSSVLMAYLRDGYGNAAALPTADPPQFTAEVGRLRASLAPHAASEHLLLMHGTDHQEPTADTAAAIVYANTHLQGDEILHSTLPAFLNAVRAEVAAHSLDLPTVCGELRSCKRFHLLPGVLSTRVWIKQRNHTCETLLEKWAEPFGVWARGVKSILPNGEHPPAEMSDLYGAGSDPGKFDPYLVNIAPILRHAWRLLMECHPHDSICGCSIDQVHAEMRPRFDQVEQIGEEITHQSLSALASRADTRPPERLSDLHSAVIVFNPVAGPRCEQVCFEVEPAPGHDDVEIVDEAGNIIPHQLDGLGSRELFNVATDRKGLEEATRMIKDGRVAGMVARDFSYRREGNTLHIEVILANSGEPDMERWEAARKLLLELVADPTLTVFAARGRSAAASRVYFTARDLPGWGYRTFWVRGVTRQSTSAPLQISPIVRLALPLVAGLARLPLVRRLLAPSSTRPKSSPAPHVIENEFLRVSAGREGTLAVFDKATGATFSGLNRFVDGGDCGDEYNYCPPENDQVIEDATVRWIKVDPQGPAGGTPTRQSLEIGLSLRVPRRLSSDRKERSAEMATLSIVTRASLAMGVPRVEIYTEIDNHAEDHRLRVHFPAPLAVNAADYDGHFEVIRRPLGVPAHDSSWVEQPRPEKPQRAFTTIGDGQAGLLVANRGLPEVEVRPVENGTEIALTLLRCVGWLSRDDFSTRRSQAGPQIATPEAQLPGRHTFEYALIPYGNDPRRAYRQADAFGAPLRAVAQPIHTGILPARAALLQVSEPDFIVSAIKASEDEAGWIVRGYNRGDQPLEVTLTPWRRFDRVEQVDLAENPVQTLPTAGDGSISFSATAHQIVTVKFSDGRPPSAISHA